MKNVEYIIGSEAIDPTPLPVFAEDVCDFINHLEELIRHDAQARLYPDVVSVGYWCRKANIRRKKELHPDAGNRVGRGLAFHITPGNIPVNFVFSYLFSLLAGNANIVRIPSRPFPEIRILLRILSEGLKDHSEIAKRTAFVSYASSDDVTKEFCKRADVRVIWGGDATVNHIRSFETKPRCVDIAFADRYSVAVLSSKAIIETDEKELSRLARGFYNDTYLMDQNACSSPKFCFWTDHDQEGKKRFWEAVAREARENYQMADSLAVDKYTALCEDIIENDGINDIRRIDSLLYVVSFSEIPQDIVHFSGKGGYFYEADLTDRDQLIKALDNEKIQTVVYFGVDPKEISQMIIENHLRGVDRIVPIGSAMDMDSDWDGFDLIDAMSRKIIAS